MQCRQSAGICNERNVETPIEKIVNPSLLITRELVLSFTPAPEARHSPKLAGACAGPNGRPGLVLTGQWCYTDPRKQKRPPSLPSWNVPVKANHIRQPFPP